MSLRQRNELDLVAGDDVEAALLPFGLGLLDPLLARRHEIPPDVARALERSPSDQHDACLTARRDRDWITWSENQQLARCEAVTRNVDFARHYIERALLGIGIEGERCAGRQSCISEQRLRLGRHRRALAKNAAGDNAHTGALRADDREIGLVVVCEAWSHLFVLGWHRHPALQAVQALAARASL